MPRAENPRSALSDPARSGSRALSGWPVVGYLGPRNEDERWWAAFRRGLGEQGYVEGRNVEILRRDADLNLIYPYDPFPELAADLVHRFVAVIIAAGTPPARAAKKATSTIPIIFFGRHRSRSG